MSRFVLAGFGALVTGAAFWALFGTIAAVVFSRTPGGAREGAGAMAGFFYVGPVCGLIGLVLGGWLTWRILANPNRAAAVTIGLVAMVVLLISGVRMALRPTIVDPNDYPGQKAEFLVEVRFPAAGAQTLQPKDWIELELRSGDGTTATIVDRSHSRPDGDGLILPGSFPIREPPRTKLLAVMKNGKQLMSSTLTVAGAVDAGTAWSEWQPMEDGFQARWRLELTSK